MTNPWSKKNPFMSLWLSGANCMAGTVRGQAAAQAKRQVGAALTQAGNEQMRLWFGTAAAAVKKAKSKRRR